MGYLGILNFTNLTPKGQCHPQSLTLISQQLLGVSRLNLYICVPHKIIFSNGV